MSEKFTPEQKKKRKKLKKLWKKLSRKGLVNEMGDKDKTWINDKVGNDRTPSPYDPSVGDKRKQRRSTRRRWGG